MEVTAAPLWKVRGGLGRHTFITLYVALAVFPLAAGRITRDFGADFRSDLGSALAISAYTMLLLSFLLSGRFRTVSGRAGLDASLGMHRMLGFAATALIAGHIVISLGSPGPVSPAAFVATAFLVLLIVLAKARSGIGMRYEYWRLSHGLGAVVVAVAGYTHATQDGFYSSTWPLRLYWAILLASAIASLILVHLVRPLGRMRQPYQVVSTEPLTDDTWRLVVEPTSGDALDFEPGQYAFLALHRRPFMGTGHPFSFSSAPSDRPRIEFTIKENGDFTDTIGTLTPGTLVHLDGPYGYLSPAQYRGPDIDHGGLVLIAGGAGIAPMMSILREGAAQKRTKPTLLIYSARTANDLAHRGEIEQLRSKLDLTVHYILSQPSDDWEGDSGRIDRTYLASRLDFAGADNRLYFICGSTRMLEGVIDALDELEVAPSRMVHAENFSVYD